MELHIPPLSPYFARVRQARSLGFLIVLFVLFVALALLSHTVRLLNLDEQITRSLQQFRHPWLDALAEVVTFFGSTVCVLVMGALIAIGLFRASRPREAWFCLFALLGLPLNWLIKQAVDRSRPTQSAVQVILHATGLSFPSGHSMVSVMFYGFLAFLFWTRTPQTKLGRSLTVALIVLVIAISLSRIYLGVHWFSDVVGGWIAGLFFLFFLIEIYRAIGQPAQSSGEEKTTAGLAG
jgi:undecaprenyl-diphosphatase